MLIKRANGAYRDYMHTKWHNEQTNEGEELLIEEEGDDGGHSAFHGSDRTSSRKRPTTKPQQFIEDRGEDVFPELPNAGNSCNKETQEGLKRIKAQATRYNADFLRITTNASQANKKYKRVMGQVKKFSRMAKLYKPGGSGISVSSDASACFQRNEQKKQEAMKTPPKMEWVCETKNVCKWESTNSGVELEDCQNMAQVETNQDKYLFFQKAAEQAKKLSSSIE